jgi:hypothetical protein
VRFKKGMGKWRVQNCAAQVKYQDNYSNGFVHALFWNVECFYRRSFF